MAKKVVMICVMALLLPYIITLAWTGRIEEKKQVPLITSGKKVILDRKNGESYMDVEEYLPGVVAKQIPAEYGKEALRAQAVIARTFIYQKMNGQDEVKESELHMEYLEEKQMEAMWGSESFVTYFQAVEEAVRSTAGEVITYDGKLIEPLFHRASTGMTRTGDESHPYLQAVASKRDVEAEGYLTMMTWSKEDFAGRINQIADSVPVDAGQLPQSIQIIVRRRLRGTDSDRYKGVYRRGGPVCAGAAVSVLYAGGVRWRNPGGLPGRGPRLRSQPVRGEVYGGGGKDRGRDSRIFL